MKSIILAFVTSLFFFNDPLVDVQERGFVIHGKLEGLKPSYLYMYHSYKGVEHRDSLLLKDGTFQFSGKVAEPSMCIIFSKEVRFQKVFYVENSDMKFTGNVEAPDKIVITGSPVQSDYSILDKRIAEHRVKTMAIYDQAEAAKKANKTQEAEKLTAEADKLYRSESAIRKQFIAEYSKSYAALSELLYWTNESNYREASTLYAALSDELKATDKAKEIVAHIANLEVTQVGKPYVDFTMNDIKGNPVKLSSYAGKYVLLEFWASWCGPCRAENPNLREQYAKFKDKGFNILGVSLDDKEDRWSKALEKDNLPWTQVSDLKGWHNAAAIQYGVRAIPANFLISPEGKIIARDLRGEALNAKLSEIFP
ncbi:TlpA disulfide reductase family protein [Ohtaekwangia koreensis]|uniref:Peroxiredoxin n=1 Tax=Ohtaekwangia koreensis TaxID=688867 RepID=A0A1T5J2N4_9BACT|nr:TlpA disulfide reductase family protein [Ohtaekwangia koreensis]SKC45709.1 Peroxiredoxin [Ohtaekwangia koreensis]